MTLTALSRSSSGLTSSLSFVARSSSCLTFSSPSPPSISNPNPIPIPSPRSAAPAAATSFRHFSDWRRSPISHRALIRSSASVTDRFERRFATMATKSSYEGILTTLSKPGGGEFGKYFSLPALDDPRIDRLPFSIMILLESAIRNCDGFQVMEKDVEKILDWDNKSGSLLSLLQEMGGYNYGVEDEDGVGSGEKEAAQEQGSGCSGSFH